MTVSSRRRPGRVFRSARELGAHYRAALAYELAQGGYEITQATGNDGRYFEITGVPQGLRDAFSGRSREVARAAERFRARTGREPQRGELRDLALENRRAKTLTTRSDLERVWRETGREHGFGAGEALAAARRPRAPHSASGRSRIASRRRSSSTTPSSTRRICALSCSSSPPESCPPSQALQVARGMVRDRRVLTLEGGRMTTLAVRAQEQAIERRAHLLAEPAARDVGERARTHAISEVAEHLAGTPTPEQISSAQNHHGRRASRVLVGPAGTGKGCRDRHGRARRETRRAPHDRGRRVRLNRRAPRRNNPGARGPHLARSTLSPPEPRPAP